MPATPSSSQGGNELEDLLLEELLESPGGAKAGTEPLEDAAPRSGGRSQTEQPAAAKKARLEQYCPPHPGYMGGICIRCGMIKEQEREKDGNLPIGSHQSIQQGMDRGHGRYGSNGAGDDEHLTLDYIHHGLEVSKEEAERLRGETKRKAIRAKKLLLVLDLDHTLLHSTRMTDVSEQDAQVLHGMLEKQSADAPMLFHLGHMNMWTKFRPGIREFLEKAKALFDLHVFTMGDKMYAKEMEKILDPSGSLFRGRVASSSDANSDMMKDLDVLLGSDDMMVILDDTLGVWPKHKANVIQMKRYLFFPACAVKFGASGSSYMEVGGDEDAKTGALACAFQVLKRSHAMFFKEGSHNDIRECLATLRSRILQGCCILFSRVIPKDVNHEMHPAWVLAKQMGAVCVNDICDEVTHIVAGGSTSKTDWGKQKGKFIVSTEWLHACGMCINTCILPMYTIVAQVLLLYIQIAGFSWTKCDERKFRYSTSTGKTAPLFENEAKAVEAAKAAAGRSA